MTIILRPFQDFDAAELSLLTELAFADDPFHQAGFPADITDTQRQEYRIWREKLLIQRARAGPGSTKYVVAVDEESGRIAGLIGWIAPSATSEGPRWPGAPTWVTGYERKAALFTEMRAKVLGERRDVWVLKAMAVHPDFQGQGVARRLIKDGLEDVDRDGLECYVESTQRAVGVYQKAGFVVKETKTLLNGTYVLSALLRPARYAGSGEVQV